MTNNGASAVAISSVSASSDFAQTNNCPASLNPQTSCTISVTLAPSSSGPLNEALAVVGPAGVSSAVLAGFGSQPQPSIALYPPSTPFASQLVGTVSRPINVSVSNQSTAAPLTISNIQVSGGFGQTNNCTQPIPPQGGCTVGVFFQPTVGGNIAGTLTVTGNAIDSPQTVALVGVGWDFALAAASTSPTSVTVAAGQSATFTLLLSSLGGFPASVSLGCSGAPVQASCVTTPDAVTLSPNGSTAVTVSVTTMASSVLSPRSFPRPPARGRWSSMQSLFWLVVLCAFFLLALAGPVTGHRILTPRGMLMGVVLLISPLLFSCGGSGGTSNHVAGTPAGTYTLNISGFVTEPTMPPPPLTHSVQLNLTVR